MHQADTSKFGHTLVYPVHIESVRTVLEGLILLVGNQFASNSKVGKLKAAAIDYFCGHVGEMK